MRLEVSFLSITTKLMGGILVSRKKLPKSFSVVCIGLLCLRMLVYIARATLGANSLEKSVGEI